MSDIIETLREVLDSISDDERLIIVGPTFNRVDGRDIEDVPTALLRGEEWGRLETLSEEELRKLGLQPWGEHGLWLFPYEWAEHIPDSMVVVSITGETKTRADYPTKPDKRFGALSFGIAPEFEEGDDG